MYNFFKPKKKIQKNVKNKYHSKFCRNFVFSESTIAKSCNEISPVGNCKCCLFFFAAFHFELNFNYPQFHQLNYTIVCGNFLSRFSLSFLYSKGARSILIKITNTKIIIVRAEKEKIIVQRKETNRVIKVVYTTDGCTEFFWLISKKKKTKKTNKKITTKKKNERKMTQLGFIEITKTQVYWIMTESVNSYSWKNKKKKRVNHDRTNLWKIRKIVAFFSLFFFSFWAEEMTINSECHLHLAEVDCWSRVSEFRFRLRFRKVGLAERRLIYFHYLILNSFLFFLSPLPLFSWISINWKYFFKKLFFLFFFFRYLHGSYIFFFLR